MKLAAEPNLSEQSIAIAIVISQLLPELIKAAVEVRHPYAQGSRDPRLMRLLIDELRTLPVNVVCGDGRKICG